MFTGLIEHIATISSITPTTHSEGFTFTLSNAAPILTDCSIGDSIQVNGACLTVTEFGEDWFKVGLAPETLNRTNLGKLQVGDGVNCERAMAAHTRLGGHFVQGHVDGTAKIISKIPDGNSIRYTFQFPSSSSSSTTNSPSSMSATVSAEENLMPYLIEKGYITIDGASLTLTGVDYAQLSFSIMLIAHSQSKLTLTAKEVGDEVNVEVDCVGKYVLGDGKRLERVVEGIVERLLKAKGL